jgi:hypothetical protein
MGTGEAIPKQDLHHARAIDHRNRDLMTIVAALALRRLRSDEGGLWSHQLDRVGPRVLRLCLECAQ